jgi:hypothetical protein
MMQVTPLSTLLALCNSQAYSHQSLPYVSAASLAKSAVLSEEEVGSLVGGLLLLGSSLLAMPSVATASPSFQRAIRPGTTHSACTMLSDTMHSGQAQCTMHAGTSNTMSKC